jgi:RHS repeat-associated protein
VGLSYDNASRRTCLSLPNGVTESYGYDNASRVTSIAYGSGGNCSSPPSNLGNLTYTYDTAGRRLSMGGSLAAVTLPANVAGGSGTTYNADNEQTTFNGTSFSFDADGNLTNDGTNTYSWNGRNQLTSISGGSSASFVYDGVGRRQTKRINGAATQFLYDGANLLQELDGVTPPAVTTNFLDGLSIDEYLTREDASASTSTFLSDAVGSTAGLVKANNGTIATAYSYQPFGASISSGASSVNSSQFTGRENDGTGLYYYRARYYNPINQRFIAQDPIGFRGGEVNLYGYVGNTPTSFRDPAGLVSCIYSIGAHSLTCYSNDGSRMLAFAEGVHSGLGLCRDNNTCIHVPRNGPAKPGVYNLSPNDNHPEWWAMQAEGWNRLDSLLYYLFMERGGFNLHLGTYSEGCITFDKSDPSAVDAFGWLDWMPQADAPSNIIVVVP